MKVAIHENKSMSDHSTYWSKPWIDYCESKNIDYSLVNCFDTNIISKLSEYDCLLWFFDNFVLQDMLFARSILNAAQKMGLKVFPDFNTSWHFDDKIAETYLLQTIDAPIPKSWVFYSKEEAVRWLKSKAHYPLVAKIRSGSGSHNVKLIETPTQAIKYADKMFGKGYRNVPNLLFKTKSNIRSAGDWKTFKARLKRAPEFFSTLSHAKLLPKERGYVYFQEYIPNDGYDLKVVVIGDKLSYIGRKSRTGDFRASGGGSLFFDRSLVSPEIQKSAFEISSRLGFQCMGFDYVVDNRTNKGIIVEISYGFSYQALLQAKCFCDKAGNWHEEPLNAPEEIIENIIRPAYQ